MPWARLKPYAHSPSQHFKAPFTCSLTALPPPGLEFDEMGAMGQASATRSLLVLSRVEPMHKLRLVELLKAQVRMYVCVCVCVAVGTGWLPCLFPLMEVLL